ncbi:sulfotransferase [Gemmata sp. JC673]|uniref:Sulfotransferase n=1 Tax=Gemmata algarum TaxID=2975278 RepID=A0ABU5FA42_9BACT|nr:sulfotransferase [Gemmata algarum]MDY3562709.1 sulfotransferase [Gemmata algarum]
MPTTAATDAAAPPPKKVRKREWAPRLWEGCDLFTWLRLLKDNGYAVQPPYWYIAAIVSANSVTNTVLRWCLNAAHGARVRETKLEAPIFVIGHWRTGTTLLHELLIRDTRFGFPDMQDCFNPQHALLTNQLFKRYASWLLPDKRPMDNMPFGWERPQEDEFALALLGLPSTYTDFAFPDREPKDRGALDLSGLTPKQLTHWKRVFVRFLQEVTVRIGGKRLVLKSPPHTARIPVLLDVFPDAKFVHIVRDPRAVFPSTVNLWKTLARGHGLQRPRFPGLEEKVLREFRVIYDRLEEARPLFKPGQFAELRYEELVREPVTALEQVYTTLEIDGYETVRPKIEEYQRQNANYERNKFLLTDAQQALIADRWGDVIRRYGYE